jgi:hypothetical protein
MGIKLHKFSARDRSGALLYELLCFICPGCGYSHSFRVNAKDSPNWTWNGSMERPTFSPSLLVNKSTAEQRCHSYVKDGRIEFLGDCHHSLAGQTVELEDWIEDDPEEEDAAQGTKRSWPAHLKSAPGA